ncbi:MAG: TauD/TfdA family dioxygenase [Pseudomonadales bacterium]|jgi:taurine dioxygenase|nr:TauD/TfdA family dioxygenase [Pseudomonadales bacterium]
MVYKLIDVDTSIGPVGAVVSGVNLSQPLSAECKAELHRAWLENHVLFFHDQDLTPAQQADFATNFGALDVYPFMKAVDTHPNVIPIIKEADAKMNFGGDWHTDTSYQPLPPKATLLYALEVPDEGGDTLFADATVAYEKLSEGMRKTLEPLTGVFSPKMVHGSGGDYNSVAAKDNLGDAYGGNAEIAEQEVEHPIIRTHAETGRKSIYCSKPHTHRIKGWTRDESIPIFKFLTKHLTQEQYVTRFRWRRGSLAMWDNRCVFHNALNDYQGKRRHMHRVIVQGERPI